MEPNHSHECTHRASGSPLAPELSVHVLDQALAELRKRDDATEYMRGSRDALRTVAQLFVDFPPPDIPARVSAYIAIYCDQQGDVQQQVLDALAKA